MYCRFFMSWKSSLMHSLYFCSIFFYHNCSLFRFYTSCWRVPFFALKTVHFLYFNAWLLYLCTFLIEPFLLCMFALHVFVYNIFYFALLSAVTLSLDWKFHLFTFLGVGGSFLWDNFFCCSHLFFSLDVSFWVSNCSKISYLFLTAYDCLQMESMWSLLYCSLLTTLSMFNFCSFTYSFHMSGRCLIPQSELWYIFMSAKLHF